MEVKYNVIRYLDTSKDVLFGNIEEKWVSWGGDMTSSELTISASVTEYINVLEFAPSPISSHGDSSTHIRPTLVYVV